MRARPPSGALARLAAAILLLSGPAVAANPDLSAFYGTYVGQAEVRDLATGAAGQRHLDIVIEPREPDGFRLHWVSVSLVDGRRDLPGVERRVQTVLFGPARDGDFFIEVQEESPFRERRATVPIRGDPVRWAYIEGDTLHVATFVVLEDGRYELQLYGRTRTDEGLDVVFERLVDGVLLTRIVGRTVRAAATTSGE